MWLAACQLLLLAGCRLLTLKAGHSGWTAPLAGPGGVCLAQSKSDTYIWYLTHTRHCKNLEPQLHCQHLQNQALQSRLPLLHPDDQIGVQRWGNNGACCDALRSPLKCSLTTSHQS